MNNADKTMDKIVALCKGRGYVYQAVKFTEVLQTLGITVLSVLNLRTT